MRTLQNVEDIQSNYVKDKNIVNYTVHEAINDSNNKMLIPKLEGSKYFKFNNLSVTQVVDSYYVLKNKIYYFKDIVANRYSLNDLLNHIPMISDYSSESLLVTSSIDVSELSKDHKIHSVKILDSNYSVSKTLKNKEILQSNLLQNKNMLFH